MGFGEPLSVTNERRRRMSEEFPVLGDSNAAEVLKVDNWGIAQNQPVTPLSQTLISLAAYNPDTPDTAPNAEQPPQSSRDEYQQGLADLARIRGGGQAQPERPAFGGNGIGQVLGNIGNEIAGIPGAIGSLARDEWNAAQAQASARTTALRNAPAPSASDMRMPGVGEWLSGFLGLNDPAKTTPIIQTRGPEIANLTQPANFVGLVAPELSFAPEAGPLARVFTDVVANTAGQYGSTKASESAKAAGAPEWLQELAGIGGGLAAGGVAGAGAGVVTRNAGSWMEAANTALDDARGAAAKVAEAQQVGRVSGTDALFTAGPNGERVGPTGNVAEMRLGREPVMGEDVNRGIRATAYGRAQQEALAAEEQAAFRNASDRAIAGADQPIGGGAGVPAQPPLTPDEFARLAAKKARGEALTPEEDAAVWHAAGRALGATTPEEQALAREAYYNAPENLGGGAEVPQAGIDRTVEMAGGRNTITNALENARAVEAAPLSRAEQMALARDEFARNNPAQVQPASGLTPMGEARRNLSDAQDALDHAQTVYDVLQSGDQRAISRLNLPDWYGLDNAAEAVREARGDVRAATREFTAAQGVDTSAGFAQPQSALDRVIARNADELPEPTRTVPQNLAEMQARARARAQQPPTAGGADLPGAQPPMAPRPGSNEPPTRGAMRRGEPGFGSAEEMARFQAAEAARLKAIADEAQRAVDADLARGARYTGSPGNFASRPTSQAADRAATAAYAKALKDTPVTADAQELVRLWDRGNRVVLDAIGNDRPMLSGFNAFVTGDVADSYVTSLLRRTAVLRSALDQAGVPEATVKRAVDEGLQRELSVHYGGKVPEDVKAMIAGTHSGTGVATDPSALDTLVQRAKNSMFGLDFGVLGNQVDNIVRRGGIPLVAGTINRTLGALNLPHIATEIADSQLPRTLQNAIDGVHQGIGPSSARPEVGTMFSYLGKPGQAIDRRVLVPVTDALTRLQYQGILTPLRNLAYEGDLTMLRVLGRDIQNPRVRAEAAANANVMSSFAEQALSGGRRSLENTTLTSSSMTRAKIRSITQMAKLISPAASPEQRILAASMIASTYVTYAMFGKWLNDQIGTTEFEFDPSKPKFGLIRSKFLNSKGQHEMIDTVPADSVDKAFALSLRALAERAAGSRDQTSGEDVRRQWEKVALGSGSIATRGVAAGAFRTGFEPGKGYRFGDLSDRGVIQSFLPTPPSVQNLAEGASALEQGAGTLGVSVYPDSRDVGDFSKLSPQEQLGYVQEEGWRRIKADPNAPKELADYGSYYDWRKAQIDHHLPLAEAEAAKRGITKAEAANAVDKLIAASPVTKAWQAARTEVKNQWVIENPQLALDLYNENERKPYKEQNPDYSLTQAQLRAAHLRLAELAQPAGAR